MSIATELTLLANSKQAIKNSINQKGGSITDSTPFADYSTAIDNLPSGGDNSTLIDLIEGDITTLNIPSGTTIIGSYSIANKPNLASVTIPNSVTSIGNGAFQTCSSLTSVTIPNSVTSIGNSTFSNCSLLTSVTIPNSVTSIEASLFYYCASLTNVTIPNSVTIIKNAAFYHCSNLKSLTIPSTVTQIGDSQWGNGVFSECSNLTALICLPTTPPTAMNLSLQYLNNHIYVPSESVETYKSASGWSSYASKIYPIQQVATVDGNPVYNYDLGNTDSTTILSTEIVKMPTGTSIEFAEGVVQIGGQLGAYEDVTLPSTFAGFTDSQAINAATETLTSLATTPPTAERNNLGGAGLTTIYVPASAVDTYKAASGWSNFASIIEGIPSPSITIRYYGESSPGDWGELEGCNGDVNVDVFEATSSSTFDSDIKAHGEIVVEDNNGNDVTSQCTFSSNDYYKWDSTQDPGYDGESEAYYEWRLDTYIGDADAQNPQSATITATYGNLSDTFEIVWLTTSNCPEPEPEPEPDPEEPEE